MTEVYAPPLQLPHKGVGYLARDNTARLKRPEQRSMWYNRHLTFIFLVTISLVQQGVC